MFIKQNVFKKKKKKNMLQSPDVDILFKGERMDIVTDFKYLGVNLDLNLNFKKHVKKND